MNVPTRYAVLLALLGIAACGGDRSNDSQTPADPPRQEAQEPDDTPAEPEIHSLAREAIQAWGDANFAELARLGTAITKERLNELLQQPDRLEEMRERFQRDDGPKGPTSRLCREWDGKIRGVRYRHRVGTEIDEYVAHVWFENLRDEELLVASFVREDGEWRFDDMHSPDKADWLEGREEFVETPERY